MAAGSSVKYDEVVMRKLTLRFFAVVPTTFSFAGAIKAAEKFDSIAEFSKPALTGSCESAGSPVPCRRGRSNLTMANDQCFHSPSAACNVARSTVFNCGPEATWLSRLLEPAHRASG